MSRVGSEATAREAATKHGDQQVKSPVRPNLTVWLRCLLGFELTQTRKRTVGLVSRSRTTNGIHAVGQVRNTPSSWVH